MTEQNSAVMSALADTVANDNTITPIVTGQMQCVASNPDKIRYPDPQDEWNCEYEPDDDSPTDSESKFILPQKPYTIVASLAYKILEDAEPPAPTSNIINDRSLVERRVPMLVVVWVNAQKTYAFSHIKDILDAVSQLKLPGGNVTTGSWDDFARLMDRARDIYVFNMVDFFGVLRKPYDMKTDPKEHMKVTPPSSESTGIFAEQRSISWRYHSWIMYETLKKRKNAKASISNLLEWNRPSDSSDLDVFGLPKMNLLDKLALDKLLRKQDYATVFQACMDECRAVYRISTTIFYTQQKKVKYISTRDHQMHFFNTPLTRYKV